VTNDTDSTIEQLRSSLSEIRMTTPVEAITARARGRRRRRRIAKGGVAVALAALLGGVGTSQLMGSHPPVSGAQRGRAVHVRLAAFTLDTGSNHTVTLSLGDLSSFLVYPSLRVKLQQDLARAGVPALISVGSFCENLEPQSPAEFGIVTPVSTGTPGSPGATTSIRINSAKMPAGSKLSFGFFSHVPGAGGGGSYEDMTLLLSGPSTCITSPFSSPRSS
jgi:hypothetical protein